MEIDVELDWNDVTNKPSTFPPSTHNHTIAQVTGVVPIAQIPTGTTATTVSLGNHAHTAPTWDSITGRPSTFPPTIGTTATTASAGNHSHTRLATGQASIEVKVSGEIELNAPNWVGMVSNSHEIGTGGGNFYIHDHTLGRSVFSVDGNGIHASLPIRIHNNLVATENYVDQAIAESLDGIAQTILSITGGA
jgi:hypothetical protein